MGDAEQCGALRSKDSKPHAGGAACGEQVMMFQMIELMQEQNMFTARVCVSLTPLEWVTRDSGEQ